MYKSCIAMCALALVTAFLPVSMAFAADDVSQFETDQDQIELQNDHSSNDNWTCWATGIKNGKRGNVVGMQMWSLNSAERSALRLCNYWGYNRCRLNGCRQD